MLVWTNFLKNPVMPALELVASPLPPALRLLDRDQEVPPEVAQARLVAYQERQRALSLQHNRALEGTVQTVLVRAGS